MRRDQPRDERGRFRRWRLGERPDSVVHELSPIRVRPGGLDGDPESIVAVFAPVEPGKRRT